MFNNPWLGISMKRILSASLLAIMLLASCSPLVPPQTIVSTTTPTPTIVATKTPRPTPTPYPTKRNWRWSNDLLALNRMVVLSKTEMWAIGQKGTIIHDYPRSFWDAKPYDYPGEFNISVGELSAIDFISPNDGWLISFWGEIFHWDGQKWTTVVSYNIQTIRYLYDIKFASSNLGWMIGCDIKGDSYSPMIRQWNGILWEDISFSEKDYYGYCLSAIDVVSASDAWIIGEDRGDYLGTGGLKGGPIVLLHWDGTEWEKISTPDSMQGAVSTRWGDISATGSSDVWIINNDEGIIAHWNGSTWEFTKLSFGFYESLSGAYPSILALSSDDVWVGGRALYHWDGNEWTDCHYDTNDNFIVDIKSDPEGNVFALTLRGKILRLSSQ